MKMINYYIIAAAFAGLSVAAKADDASTSNTAVQPDNQSNDQVEYPKYRQQELDIDLFGNTVVGQGTLDHLSGNGYRHHALWGGGGGTTFFFLKYLGVGGEYEADTRDHVFADSASGNVYLRVPILNTGLAPYIFGGGGYQFQDVRQDFGQAGGGLEFRFCKHWGIFADGRYIFADRTDNYALARAGVRLNF